MLGCPPAGLQIPHIRGSTGRTFHRIFRIFEDLKRDKYRKAGWRLIKSPFQDDPVTRIPAQYALIFPL